MDLKQQVLARSAIFIPHVSEANGLIDELCEIIREQQSVIDGFNIPIKHIIKNKEIKPNEPNDPNSENSEITKLVAIKIYEQHFPGYFKL